MAEESPVKSKNINKGMAKRRLEKGKTLKCQLVENSFTQSSEQSL